MNPLTLIHVIAGSAALLGGAAALIFRKGGGRHAAAGKVFVAAMVVMAGTGGVIAALSGGRITTVIGALTCYLVLTGWMAARRRDGAPGIFERAALPVALGCAGANFWFGTMALQAPRGMLDGLPYQPAFGFAVLALLAAAGDLNFILRKRITGVQRITRHLWRMCAAFLIAAMSFFLGQQDEFPAEWRGHFAWFVPPLAIFAALLFWLVRARVTRAFHWVAPVSERR